MPDTAESNPESASPGARSVRVVVAPATRTGWWAFGLEAASLVLLVAAAVLTSPSMQNALWGNLRFLNDVLLVVTPVALLMALVGGVLAISALVRKRERAVLVWVAAVAFLLAVAAVALSVT